MKKQKQTVGRRVLALWAILAIGFFQGGAPLDAKKALAEEGFAKSEMEKFFAKDPVGKKGVQQGDAQEKRNLKGVKNKPEVVEGEVLVKFKVGALQPDGFAVGKNLRSLESVQDEKVKQFSSKHGLTKRSLMRKSGVALFAVKQGTDEAVIEKLKADPAVQLVQPNFKYRLSSVDPSNDAKYPSQWGLHNTGQSIVHNEKLGFGAYLPSTTSGLAGADVKAPEAWAVSDGGEHEAIVAVIDSGVAYGHPDLVPNMWDGTDCVDENDDAISGGCPNHGWDFDQDVQANTEGDNDPYPGYYTLDFWTGSPAYFYSSHGTHVAGIIAGADDNGGMVGIAPRAKIMAIKTADLTTDEIVKGIAFAENNGAMVINASWGGSGGDEILKAAIADFDGLFVAAAGNDGGEANYPCAEELGNILCVAATDQNDRLTEWSNYGDSAVDVAAPGDAIVSSVGDNDYAYDNFSALTVPNLPANLTKSASSNWQSRNVSSLMSGLTNLGNSWKNAIQGDSFNPYADNADTTLTSAALDFSDVQHADFMFETACDTQLDAVNWHDYMALEGSNNGGTNWQEIGRWDSSILGATKADTYTTGTFYNSEIDSNLFTNNFKYRFRWITDGGDNDHGGCVVDNLWATAYTKGAPGYWEYYSGTSMATPFVAGLAALLWGTDDELTTGQVKDVIAQTGDSLDSLEGKTVTGKRINAFAAVSKLGDDSAPTVTSLGTGTRDYVISAESSVQLVFNEAIGSASRSVIEQSLSSGLTASGFAGSVSYAWDADGKVLTVTVSGTDAVFGNDVVANVSDILGNQTLNMLLIRSSADEAAPVISEVADGWTYDSAVSPVFNEGTATLNDMPFESGTPVGENGTYVLTVTDAAGNVASAVFTVNRPLIIESVAISNKTKSSATITWTTSISSSGAVSYGKNKKKLSSLVSDEEQSTSHSVTIRGLKKKTAYYFRVDTSAGEQNAKTSVRQFKTAKK